MMPAISFWKIWCRHFMICGLATARFWAMALSVLMGASRPARGGREKGVEPTQVAEAGQTGARERLPARTALRHTLRMLRWLHRWIKCAPLVALGALGLPNGAAAMTQLQLENGMRLFYEVRPASGLVASAVLVTAGAEHETPATNGAAHFLEHLLFDGTQSRTQQELAHDFDLI